MKKLITLVLVGVLFLGATPKIDKTQYTSILKIESSSNTKVTLRKITTIDSTKFDRPTNFAAYYKAYADYYYAFLALKGAKNNGYVKYTIQFTLLNWQRKDVATLLSTETKNNIIRLVHKKIPMDKI